MQSTAQHSKGPADQAYNVRGLWVAGEEVQDAPSLLQVALRVGLERMHQVWELDTITNEEDWEVVSCAVSRAT